MCEQDQSPGVMSILGPTALLTGGLFLLHMLPSELLTLLTVWVVGSFPIGVLIGHCALGEQ